MVAMKVFRQQFRFYRRQARLKVRRGPRVIRDALDRLGDGFTQGKWHIPIEEKGGETAWSEPSGWRACSMPSLSYAFESNRYTAGF